MKLRADRCTKSARYTGLACILRGSLAYNRNKVISLYYTDRLYTSETALTPDYEVGKAYNMLYGLKSLGINPITGLPVFQGADGSEIPPTQNPARENFIVLGHSTPPIAVHST